MTRKVNRLMVDAMTNRKTSKMKKMISVVWPLVRSITANEVHSSVLAQASAFGRRWTQNSKRVFGEKISRAGTLVRTCSRLLYDICVPGSFSACECGFIIKIKNKHSAINLVTTSPFLAAWMSETLGLASMTCVLLL